MFDDIKLTDYLSFLNYIQYEMIPKGCGHHLNPIYQCAFTCTRL